MGLFGDLDVASAADNPWVVKDGTYGAIVEKVTVEENKDKTKTNLVLIYKITDDGEMLGRTVREYKEIPKPADPNNLTEEESKQASYLKMRLSSLGVPESEMNNIQVDDLIGTDVVITVVNKNDFTNVKRLALAHEVSSDNPFA